MSVWVAAAMIVLIGVIVMAMSVRRLRDWRQSAGHRADHDQAVQSLQAARSRLEATGERARERATRLAPTDEERTERIGLDVQVRNRDHSP